MVYINEIYFEKPLQDFQKFGLEQDSLYPGFRWHFLFSTSSCLLTFVEQSPSSDFRPIRTLNSETK